MREKKIFAWLPVVAVLLFFFGCKNETQLYNPVTYGAYFPLDSGRYVTYHLDSTVYLQLGSLKQTNPYEVKYQNDGFFTDNQGRANTKITRYIRAVGGSDWTPDNTFFAVNTGKSIEFVENNMRFIKLINPVTEGGAWPGNSYIDANSLTSNYNYLAGWTYTYKNVNKPLTLGRFVLDSTVTVVQQNETIGDPTNFQQYFEVNKANESYAKGIGMVYKYFEHTVYQVTPQPAYQDGSYTIELTMIDHK